MIDMKTWNNLNRETKIFFVILFFIFLIGIFLINRDLALAFTFLGAVGGALLGLVYLYRTNILEIHKGKEKYKYNAEKAKKTNIETRVFFVVFLIVFLIGVVFIRRHSISGLILVGIWGGAACTFWYFGAVKRLDTYIVRRK